MEVTITVKKETLVAALHGELDHHTAKDVKDLIEEIIKNRGVKNLVFDFSDLSFMDSSGIGVIVGRYKLVCSIGGKVAISGASKTVEKLITMSGISRLINTYPNVDEALYTLQEEIS